MCDSLRVGGIQSALKSLLKNIKDDYKVDLFLYNIDSVSDELDGKIDIYSGTGLLKIISYTRKEASKKGVYIYIVRIILALLCRIFNSRFVYKFIFKRQNKFNGYDVAISFSNNVGIHSTYFGCNQFVISNIEAKEKVAWLHVDYESFNLNNKINNDEYNQFDKIICVSDFVKKQFVKYNPKLAKKCHVIENFIDYDKIRFLAQEKEDIFDKKIFNIISVGRLDDNKNQMLQLETALKLKNDRVKFKWYFVGDGNNLKKYKEFVFKNGIENYVIFLGAKTNPYKYISNSNLLVSSSKSESYGLTLVEALILNVPVVSMYYGAIDEVNVNNNILVCYSKDEFYYNLKKIIDDKELYCYYKNNSYFKNQNEAIMKKIKKII